MRNFFIKSEINCNENNEVIYNSYLHSKYYKCLYYQKRYTIFGLISFKIDKQRNNNYNNYCNYKYVFFIYYHIY